MLAITNEDIMPSYTVTLAAMALAAVWFARPTPARVLVVSVVFSLGWLGEWRLMFPALPGLLAALWLAPGSLTSRLRAIALLLAGIVATAAVAALLGRGHNGAVGPFDLIWTGKAVHSAWAGFSWAKLGYLRDGIAAYLLGTALSWIPVAGWDLWRYLSLVLMAGLTAAAAHRAVAAPARTAGALGGRGVRRDLRRRRGVQPLLAAAGPADADQRHAVADAGLAVRPEGRRDALAARRRDADRAGGAAARLQRLESHAAARARHALAAWPSPSSSAAPIPAAPCSCCTTSTG